MSFTLRIVFYGLIAMKPSGDETALTAVLVDAKKAGINHVHEPLLWLLQGRYVDGQQYTLQRLSDRFRSRNFTEEKLRPSGVEVIWSLFNSEVEIVELKESTIGHGLRYRPGTLDLSDTSEIFSDTDDLKWIPAMRELFNKPIRDACLNGKLADCPFSARVRLHGNGLTRSCHHVHDTLNGSDRIYAFKFINDLGHVLRPRPVVDATVVEFQISTNSITLQAKNLVTNDIRSVKIRPVNPGGRVTLIVTNHPKEETYDSHFRAYYRLTEGPPYAHPFLPVIDYSITPKVSSPGSCEQDLERYIALFRAVALRVTEIDTDSIPHDKPQCDAIQF